MDAHVLDAFKSLRSARDLPAASVNSSASKRCNAVTKSAAATATEEANELAQLHALRSHLQDAVDHLVKARSCVANVYEGPRGVPFRCHKCQNVALDLVIMRSCQHRICHRCLRETFEALVAQHVKRISPLLPPKLRQPPPVITDDYLEQLSAKNLRTELHCPFCSVDVKAPPHKAQMYSDLLAIAQACVYVPKEPDSSPESANIATYFK